MLSVPTDDELLQWYDKTFDSKLKDSKAIPGASHIAALRAIYDKGVADGMQPRGSRDEGTQPVQQ